MSLALRSLPDDELIAAIASLDGVERNATAALIEHLSERGALREGV
jgi:hypothetical protein